MVFPFNFILDPSIIKMYSGTEPFHTRIEFLKEQFEEKKYLDKSQRTTSKGWKISQHAKS